MKRTSSNYIITVDLQSCDDVQRLSTIKQVVKLINKTSKTKKRVVLRGRKPAVKSILVNRWTGRPVSHRLQSYDWAGNIVGGIKNATKLDVYIYDRRD